VGQVHRIEAQLKQGLALCRGLPAVKDVRVLGAIGVVELHQPVDMTVIQPQFVEQGVWLRPFGRLVYTMPPYITQSEPLSRITEAMFTVLQRL
jgi:adenosylmethionine---8-amino-7-oxononanoate aminotransferase